MTSQAPEKSSNFALGFLFLDKDQQRALSDVYAYCRIVDDIVDEGGPRPEAERQLAFWTREIGELFSGRPTHEVSRRLAEHIARFSLPREPFDEMIRGCRMDFDGAKYRTMEDLESYMRGVACSVGALSVRIFRYPHPQDDFAREFGYAFQLTNIIRDVGADLELGRVYLPDSEIAAAGYSREKLLRREHDEAFDRLMKSLYAKAKAYYRHGRAAVDPRHRKTIMAAEVMAHIYEGLLDEIAAGGFRVLFDKHRLSKFKKARLAARAWLYCHGF